MKEVRVLEIKESVFADNDRQADNLRRELKEQGVFLMNLMSSPGSGKTTTLKGTIEQLKDRLRIGVMEADIDSDVDAKAIAETGVKSIQLHTGGMCHLDAEMTRQGVEGLGVADVDLAILDVMLPDIDGFTILRKIREKYTFPVIMLTAKTEYRDKITGLTMGADDYIPKPFNPLELVARVKAQMRRYTQYNDGKKSDSENIIDFAGILLNKESHECIYNEQSLPLTPTEFEILWILCENRGKVISSQRLFEEVWHEEYLKNSNNTVMVHIRHLREKLSKPTGKSDLIKTVWGVGYKIEE